MARGVLEGPASPGLVPSGAHLGRGVVLAVLLAPWPAPFDRLIGDLRNAHLLEPEGQYLFGTDTQGRGVLSRGGINSVKSEA